MKLRHLLSRQYTEESPSGRLQTLPWLKSPLEENQQQAFEFVNRIPGSDPKTVSSSDNGIAQSFVPPATVDFDLLGENQQPRQIRLPSHTVKHLHDDDEPKFRVHHEASSIELFYDLFFVANLATFTSNHPIDDPSSLASYMGFFTLLWFTWFQTSLYDVRFSIDSLFSRVCKALHLGVMTGFAIVGPIFQTDQAERDNRAFRSLSIVMMVSRLILAVQYCTVLWFVKGYKRTIAPVACTIGTLFVTAMMFLGMTFGFGPQRGSNAQDGWYVVSVVEALVILAVSSRWRILSFRHTHLVERVGLLTLIILGEGIIGMTKSLSSVMQGTTTVTGGSIGLVVCAVLIIYFLYMLYFDQIDHDRFGTIRQQIWAVLHFPLHVGMLLTVEGSSEFILFRLGIELSNWTVAKVQDSMDRSKNGSQLIQNLNDTFIEVSNRFTRVEPLNYDQYFSQLRALNITDKSSNNTLAQALEIVDVMVSNTYAWIFDNLDIEVPEKEAQNTITGDEKLTSIGTVFGTVYLYFFSAAGCTLVLLSVMYYFGKTHKTRHEIISILARFIVGVGLALLTTMGVSPDEKVFSAFFLSAWILPTVTLCYGLVILLDNLLVWAGNRHFEQDTVDYTLREVTTAADIA